MRKIPVKCLNDNIIYPSMTKAAEAYYVSSGNISLVCRGLLPHISGLKFEYFKEEIYDGK